METINKYLTIDNVIIAGLTIIAILAATAVMVGAFHLVTDPSSADAGWGVY